VLNWVGNALNWVDNGRVTLNCIGNVDLAETIKLNSWIYCFLFSCIYMEN